jgi:hypothetical protein
MHSGWRGWIWIVLLPMAAALLGALTLALALDSAPGVTAAPPARAESLGHIRQWLRRHDPRLARDGRLYVFQASAEDLQMLAGQAARLAGGSALTRLSAGRLELRLSLPLPSALPAPLAGRWVNVSLDLGDGPDLPSIDRLQIGALVLPRALAEPAVALALRWWDRPRAGTPPLHQMLQGTRWQAQRAMLVYRWRADLPQRVAGWLVPQAQVQRLRVYHDALIAVLRAQRGTLDLPTVLTPLFALAQQRSAATGPAEPDPDATAAAENRAALLVLASHAAGRPLSRLLPAARDWPAMPPQRLRLAGRPDFPLHYLISAALAAEGSGALADALGMVKEVSDARYGSGFSFNDVAVNRAGTRLGEQAVRRPRQVQALLAAGASTQTLLPDVSDLPEFLPEAEFLARYGGEGAPAYQRMLADIEGRVAALALYR